jgi:hypothetical protein
MHVEGLAVGTETKRRGPRMTTKPAWWFWPVYLEPTSLVASPKKMTAGGRAKRKGERKARGRARRKGKEEG